MESKGAKYLRVCVRAHARVRVWARVGVQGRVSMRASRFYAITYTTQS